MEPGDSFLIYSDGIIDAANGDGREFGLDALRELFRTRPAGSAADTLKHVLDTVSTHSGDAPQTDDITVVVVQRR
jgi:sigma-B regulation protein RsbU (phosphoserine phosphatase)